MEEEYNRIANEVVSGQLINLNVHNHAASHLLNLAQRLLTEFPDAHLYGAEMGICYGGGVERIGKLWKGRGTIYGFDTFEDLHPEHLAIDVQSDEARCMDHWYMPEIYGTQKLSQEYQQGVLNSEELDNVILVKGEVHKDSCRNIPRLHYGLLDMDMIVSMKQGYSGMQGKFVKGGYLCLHDVLPHQHLGGYIYDWWYNKVMNEDGWTIEAEYPESHLGIYKKL